MQSSHKKNLVFINVLLNLTLGNTLLASDNSNSKRIESLDNDDANYSVAEYAAINNHHQEILNSEEQFLENLLIEQYHAEQLLAEDVLLEQLYLNEYSPSLDPGLDSDQRTYVVAADQPNPITTFSKQSSNTDNAFDLTYAAIYQEDQHALDEIKRILTLTNLRYQTMSSEKSLRLISSAKSEVKQALKVMRLAATKQAASKIALRNVDDVVGELAHSESDINNLDQLLKYKTAADFIAHDSPLKSDEISSITSEKNTLIKLAALKNTLSDLEIDVVNSKKISAQGLASENSKLQKLTDLKTLASELEARSTHTEISNNVSVSTTHKASQYLQQKAINHHIEKDSGNINYTLFPIKKPTHSTYALTSKSTAEQNVSKDFSSGAVIKQPPNEAELDEIHRTIAPNIEYMEHNADTTELLLVDAKMNNKKKIVSTLIAYNQKRNEVYAPLASIQAWGIEGTLPESVDIQGQQLIPLHNMHQINANLDRSQLTLNLSLPTEAFGNQVIDMHHTINSLQPVSNLGMFLNYDFLLSGSKGSSSRSGALISPVIFSKYGFLSTNFTYQTNTLNDESNFQRLETYFQKDFPSLRASLRIGDAISPSGDWGRSSAFTGLQFSTNFSTQPDFLTRPLPFLFSEATAPSTVDIYINDRLIRNLDVEPGPFEIRNIPPINGSGQIQFVVKDELGRERIVTSDFHTNAALLRPGVSEYSFNLGVLRENLGSSSTSYGSALGTVNYRRGITNNLTLSTKGEFSSDTKNLGLSANYNIGKAGRISSSFAVSNNQNGKDNLFQLGYGFSKERFNFSANYLKAGEKFEFIGQLNPTEVTSQFTASTGYTTQRFGSFGYSYAVQNLLDDKRSVNSLSYSTRIKDNYSINLFASHAKAKTSASNLQFGISLSTRFGNNATLSSRYNNNSGKSQFSNSYYKSNSRLFSPSYRVRTQNGDSTNSIDADTSVATQHLDIDARINKSESQSAYQVGTKGSFAYLKGGYWGFTRDISDSFAVVKVADFKNINIYRENQFIGKTNKHGYLIAPGLSPYLDNKITFDSTGLPLDTILKTEENISVPYAKSGVLIDFEISKSNSYTFTLVDEHNLFLPVGTDINIDDSNSSIVGYDGLVFVQVPLGLNTLSVGNGDNKCTVELPESHQNEAGIINLDSLVCKK